MQYIERVLEEARRRNIIVVVLDLCGRAYMQDRIGFDHWLEIDNPSHLVETASKDLVDILRRH